MDRFQDAYFRSQLFEGDLGSIAFGFIEALKTAGASSDELEVVHGIWDKYNEALSKEQRNIIKQVLKKHLGPDTVVDDRIWFE